MINQQKYELLATVRELDNPTVRDVSQNTRFGVAAVRDQLKYLRDDGYLFIAGHAEKNGKPIIHGLTEKGLEAIQAVEA